MIEASQPASAERSAAATRSPAAIVDLGVGNLGNLSRAVGALGFRSEITDAAATIARARVLLLPGVGAFRPPRETLRGALEEALREALAAGAWLLGICVGFQLLFEEGEEFGRSDGLGLLQGSIRRLPETVPLPHIGWNALHPEQEAHPLLVGVRPGAHAYFVHSFAPQDVPAEQVVASCDHGRRFVAIAGRDRVLGTQFHPEKSGDVGLRILANYLRLAHQNEAN